MMKITVSTLVGLLLVLGGAASVAAQGSGATVTLVPGYVVHGINVYNDRPIADYSQVSPRVPWLSADPLIKEIGVLDAGSNDAAVIDPATDRSLPVATIRSFADFFNPGGAYDPTLFNRPLDQIGSNFFGYTNLDQRVVPVPFGQAVPGDVYRAAGNRARPTVEEWEAVSGLMRITCREDGSASADVTLKSAFPNAVYTLWDIGVLNPLTEAEEGYAAPFGGLPNILLTDGTGCGHKVVELAFCPNRSCEGNTSCTSYVSAFYHWDAQAYGGAPAATFAGLPVGVIAGNQLVWPMTGTVLIDPQNPYPGDAPGCPASR